MKSSQVESTLIENLIELGIKRVSRRFGYLIVGNEQFLLFRFTFAKCHGNYPINPESFVEHCDFFNRLLSNS
ncbi:hypothetical protein OAM01_03425 [bacterium]|nr:hypothetical protein [bacterium]